MTSNMTINEEQIKNLIRKCYGFVDRDSNFYVGWVDDSEETPILCLTCEDLDVTYHYTFEAEVHGCSVNFKTECGEEDNYTILVPAHNPEHLLQ